MRIIQFRGGNTATMDALVGNPRELTIDTDRNEIRLHDGVTPGGVRVLNLGQIAIYGPAAFDAATVFSTPGDLPDTVVGKFTDISASGTYNLPALTEADVGSRIVLQATTSGVNIARKGADLISELGADQTSIALSEDETIEICKKSTARWVVLNRY